MTDEAPKLTFTASIQVNPNAPTERDPAELLAVAQEVIALFPNPLPLTAEDLARLTGRTYYGKRLKAAEWPEGISRDLAEVLMYRVRRWTWEHADYERLRSPSLWDNYLDHVRIDTHVGSNIPACKAARDLEGRKLGRDDLERLPLEGCWQTCSCSYHSVSQRDVARGKV